MLCLQICSAANYGGGGILQPSSASMYGTCPLPALLVAPRSLPSIEKLMESIVTLEAISSASNFWSGPSEWMWSTICSVTRMRLAKLSLCCTHDIIACTACCTGEARQGCQACSTPFGSLSSRHRQGFILKLFTLQCSTFTNSSSCQC